MGLISLFLIFFSIQTNNSIVIFELTYDFWYDIDCMERMITLSVLEIRDLHVAIEEKEILKGINLVIEENEIHALMGPNGNGKSTLLSTIMGHPKFTVTKGEIYYYGKNVLEMSVDERSRAGLFLAMQYPQEIPGVTNADFMKAAMNARREKPISLFEFFRKMEGAIKQLEMKSDLIHRHLNEGFSGGEKKRNEILQLKLLEPKMAMLDEIDSGLDVDALKIVADSINEIRKTQSLSMMVVSHYERFYQLLRPTHAHVIIDGKIVESGDIALAEKIDREGYDWLYTKHQITASAQEQEAKRPVVLGICGANTKVK